MYKKEDIVKMATLLRIDAEDFQAKLSSEQEEGLELPELKVFTDSEFEARIKNEKNDSYQDGKQAGEEIPVKELKKELGYDFEGKSLKSFLEHHENSLKEKYSKGSTERVTELESDIKKLNQTHLDAITELQSKNENLLKSMSVKENVNNLLSMMPKETLIPSTDIITIFNSGYEIDTVDGKQVVKKGGETLKDPTTAEPLDLKTVFNDFLVERKFSLKAPGRGDGDDHGRVNGSNSLSSFEKGWVDSGKSLNTTEYDKAYGEWREKHKEIVA